MSSPTAVKAAAEEFTSGVSPGLLGLGRRVDVRAECLLSLTDVAEPEIGCGRCHEAFRPEVGPQASA